MALIKCPNCQKDISDKASACPDCGYVVPKVGNNYCGECGKPLPFGAVACANCGCPVDNTTNSTEQVEDNKKKKGKKGIIILFLVLFVIIAIGVLVGVKYQTFKYENNLKTTIYLIVDNAVEIEESGNLIHDVWYNSILEEDDSKTDKYTKNEFGEFYDDFNDSLSNLYSDSDFSSNIYSIKEDHEEIISNMKDLTNPPNKYKEAYSTMKTLYDDYIVFYNVVINPKGSILDFTEDFNEADEKLSKDLDAIRLYY